MTMRRTSVFYVNTIRRQPIDAVIPVLRRTEQN